MSCCFAIWEIKFFCPKNVFLCPVWQNIAKNMINWRHCLFHLRKFCFYSQRKQKAALFLGILVTWNLKTITNVFRPEHHFPISWAARQSSSYGSMSIWWVALIKSIWISNELFQQWTRNTCAHQTLNSNALINTIHSLPNLRVFLLLRILMDIKGAGADPSCQ